MNQIGAGVSIDNLGENVTNADEARASAQLYHNLLDQIAANKLNANISLKLTHMGLDVDEEWPMTSSAGWSPKRPACRPQIRSRRYGRLPIRSARSISFTNCTACRATREAWRGDPVVYAARRGRRREVALRGIRIRLCKGAYKNRRHRLPEKVRGRRQLRQADEDPDEEWCLSRPRDHDESIIKEAKAFATRENIARSAFEFQCCTASAATCNRAW